MVKGKTRLFGIIGLPISHTASPNMHNNAFEALGLNYCYVPIHCQNTDLKATLNGLKQLGFLGFNVTIPFKEKIITELEHVDKQARLLGAVNTVILKENKWHGYNTDGDGFIYALKKETCIELNKKRVCIIGAGGSAKAIAHALLTEEIQSLQIINRSSDKAENLVRILKQNFQQDIRAKNLMDPSLNICLSSQDIIINATSLGMTPHINTCPLNDFSWANNKQLFVDLVYNPQETFFLKQANKIGAFNIGGAGMLAGQGILAFKYFTGKTISFKVFRDAIDNYLNDKDDK
eukprot:COSAG01_NODE_14_length_41020_cov_40.702133_22_plen_291_part_00